MRHLKGNLKQKVIWMNFMLLLLFACQANNDVDAQYRIVEAFVKDEVLVLPQVKELLGENIQTQFKAFRADTRDGFNSETYYTLKLSGSLKDTLLNVYIGGIYYKPNWTIDGFSFVNSASLNKS
jgi:hypothetical protein